MTQNNLRKKYGFDSIDGKIVDQSNLQFDCHSLIVCFSGIPTRYFLNKSYYKSDNSQPAFTYTQHNKLFEKKVHN